MQKSMSLEYEPSSVQVHPTGFHTLTPQRVHNLTMTCGQVHPTGFHNPADPDNKVKQLCAEILRGEGAILLERQAR